MRMRERSSVERMRMALTEKRDMLGDIVAVEKAMQREKDKEKEERGAKRGGYSVWCSLKTTKFEALVSRVQPRISAR